MKTTSATPGAAAATASTTATSDPIPASPNASPDTAPGLREKSHIVVCRESELPPGTHKIVQVGKRSIGVYNIAGEYFAIRNLCPHQFAPLCMGKVTGYCETGPVGSYKWVREGEIVRCPWHAWEFDIKTGKSIFNPHRVKTGTFQVSVESTDGSETATRNLSESDPDPAVECYSAECREGRVMLHL
jgi:3-phenylpropionate/trans-cinnamate dioxygenase ferredoxin subunit